MNFFDSQLSSSPVNLLPIFYCFVFLIFSTGLPPDISTEEFVELMSKCGIVMRDPMTEEYKVKLYKDKEGNLKGDGLCCYLKVVGFFNILIIFYLAHCCPSDSSVHATFMSCYSLVLLHHFSFSKVTLR